LQNTPNEVTGKMYCNKENQDILLAAAAAGKRANAVVSKGDMVAAAAAAAFALPPGAPEEGLQLGGPGALLCVCR
jgi:hypothetical protein